MKEITFISDTHGLHDSVTKDLKGGDILIHCGDISNYGTKDQVEKFCSWFNGIDNYTRKIFIAGNHDFFFDTDYAAYTEEGRARFKNVKTASKEEKEELLSKYDKITYLENSGVEIDGIKIYGVPNTPWFHDWAFNMIGGSSKMEEVYWAIPKYTDILITHGPPNGILDTSGPPHNKPLLGCEYLELELNYIEPKIHCFGHIHGGYGFKKTDKTTFINAACLDEKYKYVNKPINIGFE